MSKIKSVSTYNGSNWGEAVPLGADDFNVDITSRTTQPDGSAVSGVAQDSSTALNTSAVTVSAGDTNASAWTKFNRFRRRVANNFGNYIAGSIQTSYNATGNNSTVYPTSVINNYMKNVIGLTGTSTPTINGSAQTVASALSSLNSNKVSKSGDTITGYITMDGYTILINDGSHVVGTIPSQNEATSGIQLRDTNGLMFGAFRGLFATDGRVGSQVLAERTVNGTRTQNILSLYVDKNGNPKVTVTALDAWLEALNLDYVVNTTQNQIITADSDCTITNARIYTWGHLAMFFCTCHPKSNKSTTWTVGTIATKYHPPYTVSMTGLHPNVNYGYLQTDGTLRLNGTITTSDTLSINIVGTYLIP